jgi:hypothetical protein
MNRQFTLTYGDRVLAIRIRPVDEAWEFWLLENGRELGIQAVLSIDDATKARLNGAVDPVADVVASIRRRLETGEIVLPVSEDGSPQIAAS